MGKQEKRRDGLPSLARFPKAAHLEAAAISARMTAVLADRPEVAGITIDGVSSKDLDDAFWLEHDPASGGFRLQVSIADVAAVVSPDQTPALDAEARARAFTRYGARSSTPMLPRLLSEERLSLFQDAVRPAITLTFSFDASLQAGEPTIALTALRSHKRWNYEEVDAEIARPCTPYGPMLSSAWQLAERLLARRRAAGALALYDLYSGWATTEEGMLVRLEAGRRHKAQIIVQELMILVNQALADVLARRGVLALYRNHTAKAIAPKREALLDLIETAVAHPEQVSPLRVQQTVALALERARYAPVVAGHFGLNLPVYLHATSPLRRYADLVNQRVLHAALSGEPLPYTGEQLTAIAVQVNQVEDTLREAKQQQLLAAYEEPLRALLRETEEAEEAMEETEEPLSPLAQLDSRRFHSILRLVAGAQARALQPSVKREILARLAQDRLGAHDLFTLLFRFQTSGPAWQRVKHAALAWLVEHPHHALSLLLMGRQSGAWSEPDFDIQEGGPAHVRLFQASVVVQAGGKSYRSSIHRAAQKDLARSLAGVEALARMAGMPEIANRLAKTWKTEQADQSGTGEAGETGKTGVELATGEKEAQTMYEALRGDSRENTEDTGEERLTESGALPQEPEMHQSQPAQEAVPPSSQPPRQNFKGLLQERAQQERWEPPIYHEISRSGPPHAPVFTVRGVVTIAGVLYEETGAGKTKGQAEQEAARRLLDQLPQPSLRQTFPAERVGRNAVGVLNETARRLRLSGQLLRLGVTKVHALERAQSNAVGVLNELAQQKFISSVRYIYEQSGPPHAPLFTCICHVTRLDGTSTHHQASGQTKKEAAQVAAKLAVLALGARNEEENKTEGREAEG